MEIDSEKKYLNCEKEGDKILDVHGLTGFLKCPNYEEYCLN